MTADVVAELVKGAVALLLALVGGGISWGEIKKHGELKERLKQTEKERDALATKGDPSSPSEALAILRRLSERRKRLRDQTPRH